MGAITRSSLLADSLRAHALLFERPLRPQHGGAAGVRILLAFVLVAGVVFHALRLGLDEAGFAGSPPGRVAFVAALIVAFVAVHRFLVRLPFAAIGLREWPAWSRRERLYFLQVAPIAAVAFAFVFQAHLRVLLERHGPGGFVLYAVLTGFAWGIVQELLYRGWLQTELVRRFGAIAGVLVANVVFTFGPLHVDWLAGGSVDRGMIGAIFAIGLLFGVLYQRSGNLWIPAVLHGLWPLNMA
jgi:membrane protease YdiL (CAAX protease family)